MYACVYVCICGCEIFVENVEERAAPGKDDVDFVGRPEGPAGKVSSEKVSMFRGLSVVTSASAATLIEQQAPVFASECLEL